MKLSINLVENKDKIVANCPELDINCYGTNREEAVRRIHNVIDFYISSAKELGFDVENFEDIKIQGEESIQKNLEDKLSPSDLIN